MNFRKYSLTLFIGLFIQTTLGQITLNQADMPSPGDTIRRSVGLNIDFIDPAETGENQFWDFSELLPVAQLVDTFVTVTETPFFYWPFFLVSANLASPLLQDPPFPQIPLNNVFEYYDNSSSSFEDVGFAATIFGLPVPFKYDDPDVLYRFPLNYGDVDSSESGFEIGIPDVGYVLVDRKRVNTVDGWGLLKTPYGEFEVLRVKSEVTEYDSLYLDTLGIGIPLNRNYTEYKWLGKGQGLPLLSIVDNLQGFLVEYADSARNNLMALPDKKPEHATEINIYPNPTRGPVRVELEKTEERFLNLEILSLQGETVFRDIFDSRSVIEIDLRKLNIRSGQYVLIVSNSRGRMAGKIIVLRL